MVNFLLTKNKRKVNIIILFARLKNNTSKHCSISQLLFQERRITKMKDEVTLKFKKENIVGKAADRI